VQDIRWKSFWSVISFIIISLIIWAITDIAWALAFLCIALMWHIAYHVRWINQLQIWLKSPTLDSVPEGEGNWENIFSALFQTQRKNFRTETELNQALEGFKRATNALPDGVVVLNHRHEIEWCNPPAEMLLGLDLDKDVNQAIQNLVRYADFFTYLNAGNYREPVVVESIRSEEATLQIQLIEFGKSQKLLICRDISAQAKIDTMRRDFIANVSHELRTPLTVVGGFLETILDTDVSLSDSSKNHFNMMMNQTDRMRLIIEDLLTLSQIESNNEVPVTTVINMKAMMTSIRNNARALSDGKHKIHLKTATDLNIKGSEEELFSAFTNLVSNAVRYTPEGGDVLISWSLDGDEAHFSVKDSGIGIEEQHIERLTERFYRVDSSRSRDTGGTGLGLAIVKHILTRHKATLAIESTIGKGSTFSIVFPPSRTARAQNKVSTE